MSIRYPHLLSPIKLGGFVLKNRLVSANSLPHFLQGPESFPAEPVINHVVTMAKNGAAIVTFADWSNPNQRSSFNEDGRRFPMFSLNDDPSVENYICQMADQVHYYGSRISLALMPFAAPNPVYDVNAEPALLPPEEAGHSDILAENAPKAPTLRFGQKVYDNYGMNAFMRGPREGLELSREQIHEIIEYQAGRALKYKKLGFDMVTLHFAYRATLFARFLSAKTNHRRDEYGGSLENRARFLLELCARIKELCGRDFPIEIQLTASEEGGNTLEDTIALAKLCEGLVDVFQFRASTANINHPTGYNSREHDYAVLADCAAVKASGTSILCEPIGGFQDPEDMERILAEGKADLIGGARMFLCDFEFYDKLRQGRGEDIFPCVRCNKCHVPSLEGDWLSICTVNPRMGIEHRLEKLTKAPTGHRRVAVVGGGPAGMRAALYCRELGHEVTLFEASERLGGQLKLMDAPSFKWPLVRYREWLIAQVKKQNIDLRLNTPVTRELLENENFEVLILALGARPKKPPIEGAEYAKTVFETFGHEAQFGKRVVVIGGSESGTEAGLYLAENGHEVTILTRAESLATDATPIHYRETIDEYYQSLRGISYEERATATKIGEGFVEYRDTSGENKRIECDNVVALGGMEPQQAAAMALYGICADTYMIGDCREVGNIHTGSRDAFSVANNL